MQPFTDDAVLRQVDGEIVWDEEEEYNVSYAQSCKYSFSDNISNSDGDDVIITKQERRKPVTPLSIDDSDGDDYVIITKQERRKSVKEEDEVSVMY